MTPPVFRIGKAMFVFESKAFSPRNAAVRNHTIYGIHQISLYTIYSGKYDSFRTRMLQNATHRDSPIANNEISTHSKIQRINLSLIPDSIIMCIAVTM